jgi:branched-chain amino acid transport system ATP-binding protein
MNGGHLELKQVDVFYDEVQALKGIHLTVEPGEIVAIIGANGAGKSTTIKSVSGVLKPSAGEILFEGHPIGGFAPQRIVKTGISQVPEGRHVFPYMTVLENLKLGAYLRRDAGRIRASLDTVYRYFPILKERLNQNAGSLSGGEQQMLAIGRALMADPKLLMMDEPTLGLSPLLCEELIGMIETINRAGVNILLVEQNAVLALRIANRGYVMETGSIVKEGMGKDLLNDPEVKKAYLGG